jgi:BetI-type transcriptional repressor, C-terminal
MHEKLASGVRSATPAEVEEGERVCPSFEDAEPRPALTSRPAPQDGAHPEEQSASHQEPGCPQQLARGAFLLDAQQAKVVEHESYPNTQATGRKPSKPNRQHEHWTGQPRQSGEMYAQISPSGTDSDSLPTDVFRRAIASERLPNTADAEALAIAFTAMLDGLWLQRMVDPEIPAERVADAAGSMF